MKNIKLYLFCLLSFTLTSVYAQEDIGNFLTAELTSVVNTSNQSKEVLRKDSFRLNEIIQTQDDEEAVAELWTVDDSRFSLDPNSSLTFTELDVSESGCTGMKATLAYGKFRGSSGKCSGKTEIKTHIASAYAWGTDYEIVYIPEGKTLPGYEKLKPGLYEKVNEGKILIKNDAGSLLVEPGEVGYVGSNDVAPVIIPMPDFFTVASGNSKPNPEKKSTTPPIAEDPAVVEEAIIEIPVVVVAETVEETNEKEEVEEVEVNSAPIFSESSYTTSFDENATTGDIVDINAVDLQGNLVTYTLTGTDASNFNIDTDGVITLINALDYETQDTYNLTIIASDGELTTDVSLVINVNDLAEGGVSISTIGSYAGNYEHGTNAAEHRQGYANRAGSFSNGFCTNCTGNSYVTDSGTTISWGTGSSTGSMPALYVQEDRDTSTNFSTSMDLPATGTINYSVADKSEVVITSTGNTVYGSGTLDSASLAVNFSDNSVGTSLTLLDHNGGNQTTSNMTGILDNATGLIHGNTNFTSFNYMSNTGTYIDSGHNDDGFLNQNGAGVFVGSMMGNSGSNVGIYYRVRLIGNLWGRGLVIFDDGHNDSPTTTTAIADASVSEDSAYTLGTSINFNDENAGDTLTYTMSGSSWASIDASTGVITGTPANSNVGAETIIVTVTDNSGASTSGTFSITVNNVNDAPVLSAISNTTVLEDSISGNVALASATDVDANSTVTYSLSGTGSENFTINTTTGQISVASSASIDYENGYDPVARIAPVYNLTVTATDENNATDTTNVQIAITDVRGTETASMVSFWNADEGNGNEGVGAFDVGPFTTDGAAPNITVAPVFANGEITRINYYDDNSVLIGYSSKIADTYDRSGSYALDDSTVYWAYWNDSDGTEIENGVSTVVPELSLTILEDSPNDFLSLPTVGVLNYGIAEASPVFYNAEITNSDPVTYGTLNSADLYINFYDNNIGAQFTVTSPTGTVTTSDFITAVLIQQTGQFFGQTGVMNFIEYVADNNTLDYEFFDHDQVSLNNGNAFMQGTMMGNSGSHVGVVYGVDDGNELGIGAVLFEAIENINLNMTFVGVEGIPTDTKTSTIMMVDTTDSGDLDVDYTTDNNGALISFGAKSADNGEVWKQEAYDTATSQTGASGVTDSGSYATSSNTTIEWGIWSATLDTSYNTDGSVASTSILDGQINMFEDRRDTSVDMSLPITGTINYDIADQSVVAITDTTTGDYLSNGTLDSADMNINFATNAVDTQFVITDDTNTQITSDIITGVLDPTSGFIIGQSGGYGYTPDINEGGVFQLSHAADPTLAQGDGAFFGSMMGDNGSHAGVVYQVELGNDSKIGAGVVIFEAQ